MMFGPVGNAALAWQADDDEPAATEENAEDEVLTFPKLEEMVLPDAAELLTGSPRDWIVLKNGDVVVCEPVVPRPETLALRQAVLEQKMEERRGKTGDELQQLNDEIEELNYLEITIPELTENPEFRLELRRIDTIIHHEDQMLRRIDALLNEGEVPVSLELLTRLKRLWPNWPGLDARHNRLLFVDAGERQAAGNPHQALVLLSELYDRQPDFPGLSERMGQVIDVLVTAAIAEGDYRQARYFLLDLARRYNDHPVFQQHAGDMQARADALLNQAGERQQEGQYALSAALAAEAADLWPRTPNLLSRIRAFVERYQRLHVGVVNVAESDSRARFPDRAEQRRRRLGDRPLFELDRVRNGTTFYRTRYFDEWEPFDLGRRVHFTLSQVRQPWDTRPILDGPAFAQLLKDLLSPDSEDYDERFDAYVRSIRVVSPVEVTITFDRVPPRVEPLLHALTPSRIATPTEAEVADGASGGSAQFVSLDDARGEAAGPAGAGFQPVEWDDDADTLTYRRTVDEPDGLSQYHVAEVVEHRYSSHEKALQALRQGEVSMLPDLPDWILRRFLEDEDFLKDFFIQRYALPRTHIIQINPDSAPLRNGELRRGLIYALDRERILRNTVLRDDQARHGRVVAGPFPADSFANSIEVTPRKYNLSTAAALVVTAAKTLEGIPPLRMLVPPGPVEQAAAADLVRTWESVGRKLGLQVQIISDTDPDSAEWDLAYRTMQMAEPTVDLWPFLTASKRARIEDLNPYPDWLKQELVALDRTSDTGRAINRIQELHQHLWSEALFIPLWEVDEFLVIRKNISGFPTTPIDCYQGIEQWAVGAFYASE
jgi:ABC-type transport system substrate-binding protein